MPVPFFPFQLLFLLIIIFPASFGDDHESYLKCSPHMVQCGNIPIVQYPFTGNSRPDYCGHPGFELECGNNEATIEIMSERYRLLEMNYRSQILRITRMDLLDSICIQRFFNTTLDFTLFDYTRGHTNLTLFYGCSSAINNATPTVVNCSTNGNDVPLAVYFMIDAENVPTDKLEAAGCKTSASVPITEAGAQALEENLSTLATVLNDGFSVRWLVDDAPCNLCMGSGGRCGYDSTSNRSTCYCADQPYESTCSMATPRGGSGFTISRKIVIAVPIFGFFIMMGIALLWCYLRKKFSKYNSLAFWKRRTKNAKKVETFLRNYGSLVPKRYKYSDIKKLTKSFKDKLGQGGYGDVFKGKLPDGTMVAVKVLTESKGNGEEFINEVASISGTSHVNVVRLLGFCFDGPNRALIYEFMPNGSLEKFIYGEKPLKAHLHLGWERLYQIAVGIGQGLEYLHRGCNTRILHFDIKPHNILLDQDFCPKISDFGLAKLCPKKGSVISMAGARGTIGYIAPEIFSRNFGGVSHKSDVYSYGMMVLEIVGGKKNIDAEVDNTSEIYFPHWIYKRLELDEDLALHGVMTTEEKEIARKMIMVGLWCIQTDPSNRPSMSKVVDMLEGSLGSMQIPPKPYLSSPPRSSLGSSSA